MTLTSLPDQVQEKSVAAEWRPVWDAKGFIKNEPVLLVNRRKSRLLEANLLFKPTRILKVTTSDSKLLPVDWFVCDGRRISAKAKETLPSLFEEELFPSALSELTIERHIDGKRYLHFSEGRYFHDLQISVDYETDEKWTGPVPDRMLCSLPRFTSRLGSRLDVSIVLLGDSISHGANASGCIGAAPFQQPYGELAVQSITKRLGINVEFNNLAKPQMTSEWGREQADAVSDCMPDLVVIAFGMNDASDNVSSKAYQANIKQLMARVSDRIPIAEFVLISGMLPNPAWNLSKRELRDEMHRSLVQLSGPGVAVCDVRAVWEEVVRQKGFWSLTGNGVNHPNDFGHRIYADCLVEVLMKGISKRNNPQNPEVI